MPIKALENRPASSALPIIARLYKGGESTGNRPGKDLDHFRAEFPEHLKAELEPLWQKLYGSEPREFSAVLAGGNADEVWQAWYEKWATAGLVRRCDGENIVQQYADGKMNYTGCGPCQQEKECGCAPSGRLRLILPELWQAGYIGVVALTTHSIYDIGEVTAFMSMVSQMTRGASLFGVPVVFGRRAKEITIPRADLASGRTKSTKSLLYIQLAPAYAVSLLQGVTQMAALPANVDPDTGEITGAAPSLPPGPVVIEPSAGDPPPPMWYDDATKVDQFWAFVSNLIVFDDDKAAAEVLERIKDETGALTATNLKALMKKEGSDKLRAKLPVHRVRLTPPLSTNDKAYLLIGNIDSLHVRIEGDPATNALRIGQTDMGKLKPREEYILQPPVLASWRIEEGKPVATLPAADKPRASAPTPTDAEFDKTIPPVLGRLPSDDLEDVGGTLDEDEYRNIPY